MRVSSPESELLRTLVIGGELPPKGVLKAPRGSEGSIRHFVRSRALESTLRTSRGSPGDSLS